VITGFDAGNLLAGAQLSLHIAQLGAAAVRAAANRGNTAQKMTD